MIKILLNMIVNFRFKDFIKETRNKIEASSFQEAQLIYNMFILRVHPKTDIAKELQLILLQK